MADQVGEEARRWRGGGGCWRVPRVGVNGGWAGLGLLGWLLGSLALLHVNTTQEHLEELQEGYLPERRLGMGFCVRISFCQGFAVEWSMYRNITAQSENY